MANKKASAEVLAKARASAKKTAKKSGATGGVKAGAVLGKKVAKKKIKNQAKQMAKTSNAYRRELKTQVAKQSSGGFTASEKKRLAQGNTARATRYVAESTIGAAKKSTPKLPNGQSGLLTDTSKRMKNNKATRSTLAKRELKY